jgi:hypothetical protein
MKRLKIPGVVDVFKVSDPQEIHALAQDPRVDREFTLRTCPFNWLLLKRSLSVLSVGDRRFPTMIPRDSSQRKKDQQELSDSLNEKIPSLKEGPEELESLANWVRGVGADADIGILAQQFLGRLFFPGFVATEESWAAAQVFVAAPRSWKMPTILWWWLSGKVGRAKRLLAGMVDGNLSAMNAIAIAVHNLVKGLRRMRKLYADNGTRSSLTPEAAAQECLFAPLSLYRQATAAGELNGCPFPRKALFIFEIGKASQREGGRPLVFMDQTWSHCPAAQWVPALMEGLWLRAIRAA